MRKIYYFAKDTINVFIVILRLIKNNHILKYRKTYRKIEKNKRVHILANGPSLQDNIDIINQQEDDIYMMNYSPNTKEFFIYKPKVFFLMDPIFLNKTIMFNEEKKKLELKKNLEKVNWNMDIVVPSYYISLFKVENANINIVGLNTIYADVKNISWRNFLYKQNMIMPLVQTVVIAAMYYAIQSGYNQIFLHGANMDLHHNVYVDKDNNIILKDSHYYSQEIKNFTTEGRYLKGEVYKLIEDISKMLRSYNQLSTYSDTVGVSIYNCANNSQIDSFERI